MGKVFYEQGKRKFFLDKWLSILFMGKMTWMTLEDEFLDAFGASMSAAINRANLASGEELTKLI